MVGFVGTSNNWEAAMPLTRNDVLDVLADPVISTMNFWVGPVHISGTSYAVIRDHIRADNIHVESGTSNLAFYDDRIDTLTTQAGTSPPNLDARAQLLHECTHALIDVFGGYGVVTRHLDELASYIAQHVYIMRSDPTWVVSPNNVPWFVFYSSVAWLIRMYGLHTPAGNGRQIGVDALEPLRVRLQALPGVNYGTFVKSDPTAANGLIQSNPVPGVRQ
jgi:hypothetical protein